MKMKGSHSGHPQSEEVYEEYIFDSKASPKKKSPMGDAKLDLAATGAMESAIPDLDLPEVVQNGPYQMILIILLSLTQGWVSFETIAANFLSPKQQHWCFVPEFQNFSAEARRKVLPFDEYSGNFAQCEMYNIVFEHGGEVISIDNSSTTACPYGYEYQQTDYGVTATSEFDIVCGSSWIHDLIDPIYLIGMAIGAFSSGFIADIYGRKRTLLVMGALELVFCLVVVFSPNVWIYTAARSVVGFAVRAVGVSGLTLMMEVLPSSQRGFGGVIYHLFYILNSLVLAGVAYILRNFRALQLVIACTLVLKVIYIWLVPESPRWLVSVGRLKDAGAEIARIAKWNGRPLPVGISEEWVGKKLQPTVIIPEDTPEKHPPEHKHTSGDDPSLVDLFRHPVMRRYCLSVCYTTSVSAMLFYGISLTIGQLAGNVYTNMLISGVIDVINMILLSWLTRRYGRIPLILVFAALATVFMYAAIPFNLIHGYEVYGTYVTIVGKSMNGSVATVVWIYVTEIMPTSIRQRATGLAFTGACVSSIIAPVVLGTLMDVWAASPSIIFGTTSLLTLLLFVRMPETKGAQLPSTIEDAVNLGSSRKSKTQSSEEAVIQSVITFGGHINAAFSATESSTVRPISIHHVTPDHDSPAYTWERGPI